jgi:hypothetical protein
MAAVQDQPVVCVVQERRRDDPQQPVLDRAHRPARCQSGAVRDPEHVRIDRERRLAERAVEYDAGGLASDAGQAFERLAIARSLTAIRMWRFRRASPSASIRAGVGARPNSERVAVFTLLSVACAESMTAMSSSKGLRYSSSERGCGLAARSASKICAQAAGVKYAPPAWPR